MLPQGGLVPMSMWKGIVSMGTRVYVSAHFRSSRRWTAYCGCLVPQFDGISGITVIRIRLSCWLCIVKLMVQLTARPRAAFG